MEPIAKLLNNADGKPNGMPSTFTTTEPYDGNEYLHRYNLDNMQCEKCHNTGYITEIRNGIWYSNPCECLKERVAKRRLAKSGMDDMAKRNNFSTYSAEDAQRRKIKDGADQYATKPDGWFFISGRSGSGKTHICTAICNKLMENGHDVVMMLWKDASRKIKADINDQEADEMMTYYKEADVLYIDDFLKGGVTDADMRLAFELLNYRYNDLKRYTVISSEMDIKDIMKHDEAVAGRIYERSKGKIFRTPNENWRTK
jgi:DNA replication protein DnaC